MCGRAHAAVTTVVTAGVSWQSTVCAVSAEAADGLVPRLTGTRVWNRKLCCSERVRRQGLEPRTRGLRARFLLLCEVSGYTGGYQALPVRARHRGSRCRVVPAADGWYRGRRANTEQTTMIVMRPRWPEHRLTGPGYWYVSWYPIASHVSSGSPSASGPMANSALPSGPEKLHVSE